MIEVVVLDGWAAINEKGEYTDVSSDYGTITGVSAPDRIKKGYIISGEEKVTDEVEDFYETPADVIAAIEKLPFSVSLNDLTDNCDFS